MGGCSGVEVLLIWILHWSLLAAIAFCWLSKLLVTTLPCCSLTAWMASCIVLWIIAISGVGKYTVLTDKLPDSGDDGFEASLLLGSLLASYSDVISTLGGCCVLAIRIVIGAVIVTRKYFNLGGCCRFSALTGLLIAGLASRLV